jgi:hypothetical protein
LTTRTRLTQYSIRLNGFFGFGVCRTSIITSALLATLSLFYVYTLGSHLPVIAYFFLTRFTYIKPFNDYIVNRNFGSVIVCAFTLVWLILSINRKPARTFVSSVFGVLLAIAISANNDALMSLLELATLPLVVFFLFLQMVNKKRPSMRIVKNYQLALTFNYLVIIANILGIISIIISLSVILASQSFSVNNVFATRKMPVDNSGYEIFIFFRHSLLSY